MALPTAFVGEHLLPGQLGHAFIITSFVAALLASFAFSLYKSHDASTDNANWLKLGRFAFRVHSLAVLGIGATLFTIILNQNFEYFYAWSHASKALPVKYIISCFWEGQEGSFLLWTFWNAVLGNILIRTAKKWEAPVLAITSAVQVMLASMLLGIWVLGYKVGSNPFMLLRNAMPDAPFLQTPNYLASITDGNGLNPLLQNYWMVIHPPVLFLGFASTVVPFAYACAALLRREYKSWIAPALPWALFSVAILGTGIMMGGAWAYESLSFGGYWAWDPVENASLIPWLTMIAGVHVLVAYRKTGNSIGSSFILMMASFLLVLYATFLTRSGILGSSSVHAFTDLGMSGQLLVLLGAFLVFAVGMAIWRWRELPFSKKEESTYSREFWMFIGTLVLVVSCFQIIISTSIPVYNKVFGTNIAPPADPIKHYDSWQLPIAVLVVLLAVLGQNAKWKKTPIRQFFMPLLFPAGIAAVTTGIVAYIFRFTEIPYLALLFASLFAVFGNVPHVVQRVPVLLKNGGAVSHIGIALMLLGVLISSARKQVISLNVAGVNYGKNFDAKNARENVLLQQNKPMMMGPYEVSYIGDSTSPPNTYYKVAYTRRNGSGQILERFVLHPNAQQNPKMGLIASPDTRHYAFSDVYTHVSQVPDLSQQDNAPKFEETRTTSVFATRPDTIMLEHRQVIFGGAIGQHPRQHSCTT